MDMFSMHWISVAAMSSALFIGGCAKVPDSFQHESLCRDVESRLINNGYEDVTTVEDIEEGWRWYRHPSLPNVRLVKFPPSVGIVIGSSSGDDNARNTSLTNTITLAFPELANEDVGELLARQTHTSQTDWTSPPVVLLEHVNTNWGPYVVEADRLGVVVSQLRFRGMTREEWLADYKRANCTFWLLPAIEWDDQYEQYWKRLRGRLEANGFDGDSVYLTRGTAVVHATTHTINVHISADGMPGERLEKDLTTLELIATLEELASVISGTFDTKELLKALYDMSSHEDGHKQLQELVVDDVRFDVTVTYSNATKHSVGLELRYVEAP